MAGKFQIMKKVMLLFYLIQMTQSLDFYYDEYSQTDLTKIEIPSNARSIRIYRTSITVIPAFAFVNLTECTSLSITLLN